MKKAHRGYTIIEVLLVLAISGVLFISATSVFSTGRKGTEFSQGIYDIQSKIKQYAVQISTGNFLESTQYVCSRDVISGRATLSLPPSGTPTASSNEDCIYIGKAFLPVIGTSDIYVYDVLGLRNVYTSGVDSGVYSKSVKDAMVDPAGLRGGGALNPFTYKYTNKYSLVNGLKIVSAKNNGASAGILKIYSTFENNNTSSRGITAYSNSYTYQAGDEQADGPPAAPNTRLLDCIEEATTCTSALPLENNGWDLCMQSADGSRKAVLTVKPSSNGLVSKINVTSCS